MSYEFRTTAHSFRELKQKTKYEPSQKYWEMRKKLEDQEKRLKDAADKRKQERFTRLGKSILENKTVSRINKLVNAIF